MQVRLSSGEYNIVNSGQTFLFGEDKDLTIDIIANDNFEFSITLKFLKDTSGEQRIESEIIENAIIISCINFDDIGTGLISPVRIAAIDGKELYIMFWSYLKGQEEGKVRSVKYTIFYEK